MQFGKLLFVILHHACYRRVQLCVLPPLYNVIGTVTEKFPLFVHDWPHVDLYPMTLDVAALLGHVPHYLA